jgi:TetR/AcrR family fatty acid metabolism transcriptional regulator
VRSENGSAGQRDLTFIEAARRAQIVTAAIDTIAELGYGQASLARIAERAGTSKGVISYHFAGKDDLIREIVAEVLAKGQAYMLPRILAESSGAGMLRAYIESNLAFMREHRRHLMAFLEIFLNARGEAGSRLLDEKSLDYLVTSLEQLLAHFQAAGDFRADFDPHVMALAIRGAIEQVPPRLARYPDLDVDRYARELAALFDLATRPQPERPEGSPP